MARDKILRIEPTGFKVDDDAYNGYDGFEIVTDKQSIKIGVSSGQSCCESYDCISSEDDFNKFVGARIRSIARVDTGLTSKIIAETEHLDEGDAMFINIDTTKGLLQFVAYNCHNGYYGHTGILLSRDLNLSEGL